MRKILLLDKHKHINEARHLERRVKGYYSRNVSRFSVSAYVLFIVFMFVFLFFNSRKQKNQWPRKKQDKMRFESRLKGLKRTNDLHQKTSFRQELLLMHNFEVSTIFTTNFCRAIILKDFIGKLHQSFVLHILLFI